MTSKMTVKCAWCSKIIGEKAGKKISHHICDKCMKVLVKEYKTDVAKKLLCKG